MSDLKSFCGKTHSTSGKPFSEQSLRQHNLTCRKCHNTRKKEFDATGIDMDVFDSIGDDVPDGAFWAMYEEMGGTF